MSFVSLLKKVFLILGLPLCFTGQAWALMATASVDKNRITMDETVTLYIEVLDDPYGRARQPRIQVPGFGVGSMGSSTRVLLQNGRMSTTRTYTYVLSPRLTGKLTIPAVRIDGGGEVTTTQPIIVEVVKGASESSQRRRKAARTGRQQNPYSGYEDDEEEDEGRAPAQSPQSAQPQVRQRVQQTSESMFLTAVADKTSAYPGEQITLSVTFYTMVPLADNPQYLPPVFKNFMSEDLPPVRNGQKSLTAGGAIYGYSEIKTALFGLASGQGEIQEATVTANVASAPDIDPFDPNFIQNFMNGTMNSTEKKVLKSKPFKIRIKPLPAGAPASFSGAVGSYTMRSMAEKGKYKEGEPLSFTVTVSGRGNLKSVTAPKFKETPDFKVFDTQVATNQTRDNDRVGGKKTFTYLLVPRSAGHKVIPSLSFSYFDPSTEHYYTLNTKPAEIEVARSDTASKNVVFNPSGAAEQVVTATGTDIRYVTEKTGRGPLASFAASVVSLPGWIHILPLLMFVVLLTAKSFSRYREKNPQLFRFKGARGKAFHQLDEAGDMIKAGQSSEAVSLLYDAFMDYLSDKCGEKVSAMQVRKAIEVIRSKFPKVKNSEADSIRNLWQELEMHHYAPGKADKFSSEALLQQCRMILKMLDGKLK